MSSFKIILFIFIIVNLGNDVTQGSSLKIPECKVPNYEIEYMVSSEKLSCGKRHVTVKKIGKNQIKFTMLKKFDSCTFCFIDRSKNNTNITLKDSHFRFLRKKHFKNNTITSLSRDFIHVECKINKKVEYVDSYAIIKPIDVQSKDDDDEPTENKKTQKYNVLMLGLGRMSRKHAYHSMKETVNFFNRKNWLDFQEVNKVAENTLTNLMALLTGSKHILFEYPSCLQDMCICNHKMLWHSFQERGFVTAYGEDSSYLADNFHYNCSSLNTPPTNHYMIPFFLAIERAYGCLVCSGHKFSGSQILEYILDFVTTYQTKAYFGFFFINSFSHGINQSPKFFDNILAQFFSTLNDLGVYKNTFVIFFSDHGIRYGPIRYLFESYYDERLPMLFMNVPDEFKRSQEYKNLVANQFHLASPYDLHLTLWDILQISTEEILTPTAEDCPKCLSMFQPIPVERTCADAGINVRWCACSVSVNKSNLEEYEVMHSLTQATNYLRNLSAIVPTEPCTKCAEISLKKTLRTHVMLDQHLTKKYVMAFVIYPNNAVYEVTVHQNIKSDEDGYTYDIDSIQLISKYNNDGWCTVHQKHHQFYCVCERIACLHT